MDLRTFQETIAATYGERDAARGLASAMAWLAEETGELVRALRKGTSREQAEEFADVLAWLASLAAMAGIDLDEAATTRYGRGCPKCVAMPCRCP